MVAASTVDKVGDNRATYDDGLENMVGDGACVECAAGDGVPEDNNSDNSATSDDSLENIASDGTCVECAAGDSLPEDNHCCEVAGDYTATSDKFLVNANSEEVGIESSVG